jgi:hypothetical protein
MRISFGNRISAQSWELALSQMDRQRSTIDSAKNEAVEIDLSAAGFADFIILGRILTLVAGFASAERPVKVLLPTSSALPGEKLPLSREMPDAPDEDSRRQNIFAQRRRQRIACQLFLRQAGFTAALDGGPWRAGLVEVSEDAPSHADQSPPPPTVAFREKALEPRTPVRHRRLIPYRWLEAGSAHVERETIKIEREMAGLGIDADDCAVLAHEVVEELVQNVRDHATPPGGAKARPLFGLVLLTSNSYRSRADDFDVSLHEMIDWSGSQLSPLIRIFVGDSGQGFAHVKPDPGQSYAEAIQKSILHAMDTWTPSPADQMPRRGLWKLDRIAQSYSGSLILTAQGFAAGHVFDHATAWKPVGASFPCSIPGTMAECNVPVLPGRLRPLQEGEHYSLAMPSPALPTLNLSCASVSLGSGGEIEASDFQNFQHVLRELKPGDGLVIAAELQRLSSAPTNTEVSAFVRAVLDMGSRAADLFPVGVIFGGLNRTLLALSIQDYNLRVDAELQRAPAKLSSTFLVVAPENHHYWAGGSAAVREVFGGLSQVDAPMPLDEDTINDNRVVRQIRFQHGLRLHDALASLRLRPQEVVQCVRRHVSDMLQSAIAKGDTVGVRSGAFLTPSLRQTCRWIEAQELLEALRCGKISTFLLAALTAERHRPYLRASSQVSVVRVGSISRELARVFTVSLTGSATYYNEPTEVPTAADSRHQVMGAIICTDVISTGHTVRKSLREMHMRGVNVVAIVAIVDARGDDPEGDPQHVVVDGRAVPLLTLATASISASESNQKLTPIDPVIGAPVEGPTPRIRTRIDQGKYISAVKRHDAARLGHIARAGRRHYTAYVDATQLFRDSDWATDAIHDMLTVIKGARTRIDGVTDGSCPIIILLPTRTGDSIAYVARKLADAISEAEIKVADIISVPRAVLDAKWNFPGSISLPDFAHHAVLLDPACRSGHAIRQLVRLASTRHARSITAFVLLNGLTDFETLALQQIKAVEPTDSRTGRGVTGSTVPVSINFLARTAVTRIPAERCPICHLRRSYAALPDTMPQPLLDHRDTLLSVLEPHSKSEAFENSVPIDLFGITIEAADCVNYLTWRARLNDAVYDTERRKEVADEIRSYLEIEQPDGVPGDEQSGDLAAQPDPDKARRRDAFIRLIAAESSWLRMAPLEFDDFSMLVGDVAASIIQSTLTSELDAMLRCQATIVLAMADPQRFARDLPDIVRASADHPQVCYQVLLEVVRLLEARHAPTRVVKQIGESLTALEDLTRDRKTIQFVSPPIHLHQQVRYLSSLVRQRIIVVPDSPIAAWTALRSHYLSAVSEHAYTQPIWRLLLRLKNLDRGVYPSDPDAAIDDWLECSESLFGQALANLGPLAPILLSKRVTGHIPDVDVARWHAAVAGRGQHLLDDVSLRIRQAFSADSDPRLDASEVSEIIRDVEWWNNYFFSAPADDNSPRRDAMLVSLLNQSPASLFTVLDEAFEGTDHAIVSPEMPHDQSIMIFCTNSLLSDVFFHMRLNAQMTSRVGAERQKFKIIVSKDGSDHLRVMVLNSGSDPAQSTGGGEGLAQLATDLGGFGAELIEGLADPPMTYAVGVRLRRWRGTTW